MALLCRISQSKIKHFSNQFRRHYFQISHAFSFSSTSAKQCIFKNPCLVIYQTPAYFQSSVRGFAAPVQAKPKKEEKDTSAPRVNDQIVCEFVRLVTDEGHSIVSRREALDRARKLKLDLVEVQKTAKPPVCKIMDFHKEKYKQDVKEKDRAKVKSEVTLRKGDYKEIRFSGKTEEKDLRMKADMVKRLMERGYRVKCTAKGTEGQDLAGLLSRLSAMIEEESIIESGPRVERAQAFVIVRHVKFGPSKKGGGKKPKTVEINESKLEKEVDHPLHSSSETSEQNLDWSVGDSNDEFEKLFDLDEKENGSASKSLPNVSDTASSRLDINIPDPLKIKAVGNSDKDFSVNVGNRYGRSDSMNQFQRRNSRNTPESAGTEKVETYDSQFRNSRVSPNDVSKQEPCRPKPGYGVFSSGNVVPPNQQVEAGCSSESDDNNTNKKWGIFSREKSAVKPNTISKPG